MTKKLNCILLIDDDEATNYIHQKVIVDLECAKRVITVHSGQEALDFLNNRETKDKLPIDLIFLDINMPAMNGWEFLEHYKKLDPLKKAKTILFMLSTSLNPNDRKIATEIDDVNGFETKPLTEEKIIKIFKTHFS
ncbi:response regulator [uncultured Kriegella sp.]|uniref:response regulator n=1 Tax=uncultured Kriegella sp. TaxID=1798910 RepID=UPI0030DD9702|tara:strand:+ start:6501 stop:6908 length:408 start_codon:yes stop_codon:yes gene_type:complete